LAGFLGYDGQGDKQRWEMSSLPLQRVFEITALLQFLAYASRDRPHGRVSSACLLLERLAQG
jgi:hypothetical protein